MGQILDQQHGYLSSAQSAEGTGGAILPLRNAANYGYLWYQASGTSALFELQASHDSTGWMVVGTYTASGNGTGTAQVAGLYPYLRTNATKVYTATAAATATATLWVHFTPGTK
jgi:hypothetical protein